MNEHKLPIQSVYNKDVILKPIVIFVFICFVSVFASYPSGKGDSYHYGRLSLFISLSAILITGITFLVFLAKQKIIIDEENISFFNFFGKIKKQYKLSDIADFKWNNQPITADYETSRSGAVIPWRNRTASIKNELIYIIFKNEEIITLSFDEYENFDEIKQFLFDYCTDNKIIKVVPIEDRRYGTTHRGRRR